MVWKLLFVMICFLNLTGAVYLETYLYLYSAEQERPKKEKKNICPRSKYTPAITLIHLRK